MTSADAMLLSNCPWTKASSCGAISTCSGLRWTCRKLCCRGMSVRLLLSGLDCSSETAMVHEALGRKCKLTRQDVQVRRCDSHYPTLRLCTRVANSEASRYTASKSYIQFTNRQMEINRLRIHSNLLLGSPRLPLGPSAPLPKMYRV